jgi:Uma2 family endonuclease
MSRKLKEYIEAGTKLVWIIDPPTRTAKVHTSPADFTMLTDKDAFDGREVLPGFTLSVSTLFEKGSIKRML